MEMIEYQQYAERTAGDHETMEDRLANFGMGLAGEAGETCDYLKKVVFHGHELDKQVLCEELGDCLWYIATIATTVGLSLEDVAWANVQKLKKRYPEGFSEERSRNRVDYNTCPECGSKVIRESGCMQCPACGWSACS